MNERGDYDCHRDCVHGWCDPYDDHPCKNCKDNDHPIPNKTRSFFKLRKEESHE